MRHQRSQSGIALPTVLLFIVVLLILGFALTTYATLEQQSSLRLVNQSQAYYIARAGADSLVAYIVKNQDNLTYEQLTAYLDAIVAAGTSGVNSFGGGTFLLSVTRDISAGTILIESTGSYNGQTATADLTIDIVEDASGGPIFDMAVFAVQETTGAINLANSARIQGNAGTNSIAGSSIGFSNSARINGDVYIGPEGDVTQVITPWKNVGSYVTGALRALPKKREYPLPPFPAFPSLTFRGSVTATNSAALTISTDGWYTKLEASNSGKITIDVGTGIRTLRIDTFTVQNSGKIEIQGTGKLLLYVSSMAIGNSAQVNGNTRDSTKLHMYYNGSATLSFVNSSAYYGSMYIEKASLSMANSNSIMGNIITGGNSVTVQNSANAEVKVLYAPNAVVEFQNSASLTGALIAKKYTGSNSALVSYAPITSPIPDLPDSGNQNPSFQKGRWK
jgi:hypothetical protein